MRFLPLRSFEDSQFPLIKHELLFPTTYPALGLEWFLKVIFVVQPREEKLLKCTDWSLGSFPQGSLFLTGKPPSFYLKVYPHRQIHSSLRNTITHGHHNGNEYCSELHYHSWNRSVLVFIRRNTRRPKERARRLVKKLHTQSQNKEQRRTGGGLLFNILPIPH